MNFYKVLARAFPLLLARTLLVLLMNAGQVAAQDAVASKLTIRVADAKDSKGRIAIALFRGADGFPGDKTKAERTVQVSVDPKTMSAQATLSGLPHGDYAVAVFHDENMNGRLDKNMLGVPKEGYGFSNTGKRSMGPPRFDDAKFVLDQPDQNIEIKLTY